MLLSVRLPFASYLDCKVFSRAQLCPRERACERACARACQHPRAPPEHQRSGRFILQLQPNSFLPAADLQFGFSGFFQSYIKRNAFVLHDL